MQFSNGDGWKFGVERRGWRYSSRFKGVVAIVGVLRTPVLAYATVVLNPDSNRVAVLLEKYGEFFLTLQRITYSCKYRKNA